MLGVGESQACSDSSSGMREAWVLSRGGGRGGAAPLGVKGTAWTLGSSPRKKMGWETLCAKCGFHMEGCVLG